MAMTDCTCCFLLLLTSSSSDRPAPPTSLLAFVTEEEVETELREDLEDSFLSFSLYRHTKEGQQQQSEIFTDTIRTFKLATINRGHDATATFQYILLTCDASAVLAAEFRCCSSICFSLASTLAARRASTSLIYPTSRT